MKGLTGLTHFSSKALRLILHDALFCLPILRHHNPKRRKLQLGISDSYKTPNNGKTKSQNPSFGALLWLMTSSLRRDLQPLSGVYRLCQSRNAGKRFSGPPVSDTERRPKILKPKFRKSAIWHSEELRAKSERFQPTGRSCSPFSQLRTVAH